MKIHWNDPLQQGATTQKPATPAKPGQPAFADVLRKAADGGAAAPQKPAAPSPGMRIATAPPVAAAAPTQVHAATDRMLAAMERYRNLLGDGRVSLRQLAPALREVEAELHRLEPLAASLPADDPIKQIADHTMVLAGKEIARFMSGAYV